MKISSRIALGLFEVKGYVSPLERVTPAERRGMNALLYKAGLDGNTYFPSVGTAVGKAQQILAHPSYRLAFGEPFMAPLGDDGQERLRLVRTHWEGRFPPVEIKNSLFVLTWHKMPSGKYEVTVYLS